MVKYAVIKKNHNVEMIKFSYLPESVAIDMVIEHLAREPDENVKLMIDGKIEIENLSPILHGFNAKRKEISARGKADLEAWLKEKLS